MVLQDAAASCKPDQQLENHSTKYHRQQPLYNTLELLMMGIVVSETCWPSKKICNKNLCCIQLAFYFHISITKFTSARCLSLSRSRTLYSIQYRWFAKYSSLSLLTHSSGILQKNSKPNNFFGSFLSTAWLGWAESGSLKHKVLETTHIIWKIHAILLPLPFIRSAYKPLPKGQLEFLVCVSNPSVQKRFT